MNPALPGAVMQGLGPAQGQGLGAPSEPADNTLLDQEGSGGGAHGHARPGAIFSMSLAVHLANVGISLIVEKPVRREFLALSLFDVSGKFRATSNASSMEFELGDLQLDSYSETAAQPVLLYAIRNPPQGKGEEVVQGQGKGDRGVGDSSDPPSRGGKEGDKEGGEEESGGTSPPRGVSGGSGTSQKESYRPVSGGTGGGDKQGVAAGAGAGGSANRDKEDNTSTGAFSSEALEPVLKCSVIQEQDPVSGTPHFKYIAVRLLELVVSIDYASLQVGVPPVATVYTFISYTHSS